MPGPLDPGIYIYYLEGRVNARNDFLGSTFIGNWEEEEHVLVVQGDAENFMDFSRDFVISNIQYHVMKRLIENRGFISSGFYILSGLLSSQALSIEQMLKNYSVEIINKWGSGGMWHTYLGHVA
ncbi:MAG: hypothetical protein JRI93_02195 [Deltaproteobacteria bacterium]|nr:hypothetical protein [Deltaproteobacteria bacterium]MBW2176227.1 hypothetical protein [Deltaproteobacteria bacterium]